MLLSRPQPAARPGSRLNRAVETPVHSASRKTLFRKLALLAGVALLVVSSRSASTSSGLVASSRKLTAPVRATLAEIPSTPILRRAGGEIRLASASDVPVPMDQAAEECPVQSAAFENDTAGRLIGSWEDDYYGHRVMTLRPDGSGTMVIDIKGPAKLIVGSRLTFHVEWNVTNEQLSIHTIGGEPANKVAMITKTYGDRALQDILELSANELNVRDTDDGDEFVWRRLQPTPVAMP